MWHLSFWHVLMPFGIVPFLLARSSSFPDPFGHPVRHKQTTTVRLIPIVFPHPLGFCTGSYRWLLRSYGNPKLQGPVVFSRLLCEARHVTFAQASVWFCQGRTVEMHCREREWETERERRIPILSSIQGLGLYSVALTLKECTIINN